MIGPTIVRGNWSRIMNEGPFRMPRSTERSAANQPAEPSLPTTEPKAKEESKPVHRASESRRSMKVEKSKRPLIITIVAVVAAVLIAVGGWTLWSGMSTAGTAIDSSKYQAVFFTNGQVYFGKLHAFNDEYMKLTDVFYLQTASTDSADAKNPQKTSTYQSTSPTLIKLGDEIHGPQDEMIVSKSQVLFYENLKSDGKVSSSISQYKDSKK